MVDSPDSDMGGASPVQREPSDEVPSHPDERSPAAITDRLKSPQGTRGPALTVAAVARRLGVAPATLRTWDRRYGLGPSEHTAGAHRRYSSGDVARLLVMRRLTLEGVAPSEAARAALAAPEGTAPAFHVPTASEVMDAYASATPMAPDPAGLAAAAGQFDNAAVRWMLTRVHPRDVLGWWTELVRPALQSIPDRAPVLRPGEGAASALTAAAFAELRSRATAAASHLDADKERSATVVVVPAGRADDLPIHVLATALQSGGVRARVLSWGEPEELTALVDELAPAAALVEVAGRSGDRPLEPLVLALRAQRPTLPVFVHREGGDLDLPASLGVHRVRTMTGALHEVLAVV